MKLSSTIVASILCVGCMLIATGTRKQGYCALVYHDSFPNQKEDILYRVQTVPSFDAEARRVVIH